MVCYGISGVINNVHCIPNGMATLKPTKTLKNFRKISLCEMFLLPVIQMLDSGITVHYPPDRDNIHCIQWKALINFFDELGHGLYYDVTSHKKKQKRMLRGQVILLSVQKDSYLHN